MPEPWTPDSWKTKDVSQQVTYPDPAVLAQVQAEIARLPPLVTSWEVEALRERLARAAAGEAFLLQGGDCAESFDDCAPDTIATNFKILLQMSLLLVHGTRTPVIRVGRIAGQYAKPRSSATEERDGVTLPSYRGDIVNRSPFTAQARTPDPTLLLRGYERSALTLNFVRALADGGFADLHHPENWDLSFAKDSPHHDEYRRIAESIKDAIAFMEAVTGTQSLPLRRVDLYTSHEALSLEYEQAQTRQVPRRTGWYDLATHMPWIGMRTADPAGAHVEYCRGIRNPIGVKVGPGMSDEQLTAVMERIDPEREPGRLTLIHRLGADRVEAELPRLIEAVRRNGRTVLWCADPMHGNTETTASGIKTRRFDRILSELQQAFDVHAGLGSHLGGVHFELTGENVTECIGGAGGIEEGDLHLHYRSKVDPRLNYQQALEMALLITRRLRRTSAGRAE
ncbi:class II 3-deoxy-7-phosphoheptulonate synthase [Paraliomyxa miuraensis]|uniref:class II 3-deoxy-7-phosphoheptulonate synthase n=1 Tax=Paraliomyxa miuraensis TaxID=376150 RepID=UPI00225A47E3|nr:3-deoxy-7-phosphoheptulonate synthase class II [Paraliomyxa miuraensis]MCX4246800.1 3-deoxy-7-phosphoheptulonate synthase class II [Paraliomyxa miuraensis]